MYVVQQQSHCKIFKNHLLEHALIIYFCLYVCVRISTFACHKSHGAYVVCCAASLPQTSPVVQYNYVQMCMYVCMSLLCLWHTLQLGGCLATLCPIACIPLSSVVLILFLLLFSCIVLFFSQWLAW